MKEQLEHYVKQVRERHLDCQGNEQAAKAALIAPLFVMLGYDMSDPRECKPEFKMDFGRGEKASTPVDWAFLINGAFAFFVEAKEAGAKIAHYSEQLGMYFGKQPGANGVKLGILTNGTHWHFFTDLRNENAMDREPFFTWDVLEDDPALAVDILTILQKSKFNRQLIRTFAEGKHRQTILVGVLNRLLEPSNEFVRFAIGTGVSESGEAIESGKITEKRIEEWKPILARAIHEWAKQQTLTMVLKPAQEGSQPVTPQTGKPSRGVGLTNLIAARILTPPLKLFRHYKGNMLEATLHSDGAVEFQGQRYETCSAAAEAARMSVTGKRLNTNGWSFWQYQGADGKTLTLADAREQLAKSRSKPIGGEGKASVTVAQKRGQQTDQDRPERHDLRKKFWQSLLDRPKMKGTRHADIAPGEYSWIAAGSGVRGLQLVYAIGQEEGRVELYIDRGAGKADENKRIFDQLRQQKADIEKTFGGELSWQRLDQKQGCRIAHPLTLGGYRSDEVKWPAIQDAMIDAMIRLEKALAPHLEKLKKELNS
jgi:hypothetical protein